MSQNKNQRTKKEKDSQSFQRVSELINHIKEKYNINEDLLSENIDKSDIEYKFEYYKLNPADIDNEIESINLTEKNETVTIEKIKRALEQLIKRAEEKEKEEKPKNTNQKIGIIKDMASFLKHQNTANKNTAKAKNIVQSNENINVNYNTTIVYNEGQNEMEKQFNSHQIALPDEFVKKILPYDLLPKDYMGQKDGYLQYFTKVRENLLINLKIDPNDILLGETKFVLFIAFDVIDTRPKLEDIIGLDPLDDYKKYKLKFNSSIMDNYFFMSGQIAYIEGNLIDNKSIIEVNKYQRGFNIDEYSISAESLERFYDSESKDPYSIYYMNGPFFPKEKIDLTVFFSVLKEIVSKNPHMLIICGPIFSTENNQVQSGQVDTEESLKDLLKAINDLFINTRTKVLIAPGLSDVENYYPLPQPPFSEINTDLKIFTRINFISNPQIIPFNETYIGVANYDIVKDIIFNSVHAMSVSNIDKACELILNQKNMFPVVPNTLPQNFETNQEKINTVDLSQYDYLSFEMPPDIFLTNSGLKGFAKRIHGSVFINCGPFVRGKNYGEIAKITLHNPRNNTDINKRVKVEFIKVNANSTKTNNKNDDVQMKDSK